MFNSSVTVMLRNTVIQVVSPSSEHQSIHHPLLAMFYILLNDLFLQQKQLSRLAEDRKLGLVSWLYRHITYSKMGFI
jgi:hypothetical protein